MAINNEKYKLLYEYHKDQFIFECDRFNKLEDKATKYLSAMTVSIGAYVLLVRWIADKVFPPTTFLSWLTVVSIIITFIAMVSAWSFIFRAIKLQDLKKLAMGDEITEYFHNNKISTIHLGLSKKYAAAASAKEEQYKKKLINVRKGYVEVVFTGWCFVVSVVLIFIKIWLEN